MTLKDPFVLKRKLLAQSWTRLSEVEIAHKLKHHRVPSWVMISTEQMERWLAEDPDSFMEFTGNKIEASRHLYELLAEGAYETGEQEGFA